jgi:hypothetical protein
MNNRTILAITVVAATFFVPSTLAGSQESGSTPNPLAAFERFIGGQWHFGPSYHEFEWGVGRRSVRSRSYFVIDGKGKLVSEGLWYWHPGEKKIRGVFTAIEMPVVFFDFTTRFEGNQMVSDIESYDAKGNAAAYVETLDFVDDTHYEWKLLKKTPEGLKEEMSGTYSKKE